MAGKTFPAFPSFWSPGAGTSSFETDLVPSGALFRVAGWLPATLSALVPCITVAVPGVWCQPLVFDVGLGDLVCHLVHPRLSLAFEQDDDLLLTALYLVSATRLA